MIYSTLLSAIPGLRHGFGTRLDDLTQEGMAALRQIHSGVVLAADSPGFAGEGDGLVTENPGVLVSVRTADCFPILLADPPHRAVAAVHAGWRGTAAHIVQNALHEMHARFATEPRGVLAAIGPGIGECCYQVGLEVARKFGRAEAGCLDLATENRAQLVAAGVPGGQIDVVGGCTRCDSRLYHSFRRDKDACGRMISFAGYESTTGAETRSAPVLEETRRNGRP